MAITMATQASGGRVSPSSSQAVRAAPGGTQKNRALTRAASPARIIHTSRLMASNELASTR